MTSMQPSASPSAPAALSALARKAQGLTGADIERVVKEARQQARREQRSLAFSDLEERIAAAKPSRSMALRLRMAIHEAGHAVARLLLGFGPIYEITIEAPKGGYISGSTGQDEVTEAWLTAVLIETLAGRAAEEVMLGSISANSGGLDYSDLASATRLALDIETVLGFGGKWPLLYRKPKEVTATLAADPEVAARVNIRLERAYEAALVIVREQSQALDFLAEKVFEKATLEGAELDTVLGQVRKRFRERPG
ncbi:ATP-dependent Zn protease [Mesorhizobium sp. M2C.T.Ca.TU.002.02.1.1]|jgi:cell division protease FtsH|uniref:ATP-dependent Zn protease n=1 Tax=Mesorhizobium sp. M2C.T.Ca.TU.002.02.1.1 TaxID=2496788 RepID=UPI000FC9A0AA|nr:ATP-dependent Zn protease [Mesorhizobium sp. M2C.T.Ca.TU.002.02.1.1]RUU61347.1 ATP-dependent Zn protease [Mesorhizobium sp. M2C.T.Ca.TU.002.02.1.1]RUU71232.1 ATP-dependent Zn protease [Mesorhizobium sp. M2C.T.Ca.TU.009.01.2.1]